MWPVNNGQEEIKQILVKNIKRYREKLKLTQEQAAEKADITTKYWQRLEMTSQTDFPSLPLLFKIAQTLEVDPSKLLQK